MSTLNINNTDNQVTAVNANQGIIVIDNSNQSTVNVTQPVTSVVLVNTLGPQGSTGAQGPTGQSGNIDTSSFVTTSSFNIFTGSIQDQVTSLTNTTSSYVLNSATSSFITNDQTSSFVQNNQTSSMNVSSSLTSSFLTPGIYLVTSSQALTASYATQFRSGAVGAGGFGGTPLTSSIQTFSPAFPSTAYSIIITSTSDARNWTLVTGTKQAGSFRINSNSSTALTANVMWIAMFQTQ